MKKIYFLLLLSCQFSTQAQRFDWVKFVAPVGNANNSGGVHDMTRDEDSNIYTISSFGYNLAVENQTVNNIGNNQNLLILKWDANGNILGHKRISCNGYGLWPHAIVYDQASQHIIVSADISVGPIQIEGESPINADGTVSHLLRFEKDLDFVSDFPHLHTYSIPMVVHGEHLYYAHGYQSTVYKRDANNQLLWSLTPTSGAYSIYSITTAPDGSIYVAGRAGGVFSIPSVTLGGVTVNFPMGNSDQIVLYKIDAAGTVVSGRYITQSVPGSGRIAMKTDVDSNLYLMTTYAQPGLFIDGIALDNAVGANDGFVVKFNPALQAQWVTELHNTAGNMQTHSLQLEDDALFVTGRFGGNADFDGTQFTSGPNGTGFFSKINAESGEVLYAGPVGSVTGTGDATGAVKIGNSYYVGGLSFAVGENSGSYGCYRGTSPGLYLTKITDIPFTAPEIELSYTEGWLSSAATTDAQSYEWYLGNTIIEGAQSPTYLPTATGTYTVVANFAYGCSDSASFTVTELGTSEFDNPEFRIYPNPASNRVYLSPVLGESELHLSDLSGKIISRYPIGTQQIDVSGLASGLYVLKTERHTFKLVKQ